MNIFFLSTQFFFQILKIWKNNWLGWQGAFITMTSQSNLLSSEVSVLSSSSWRAPCLTWFSWIMIPCLYSSLGFFYLGEFIIIWLTLTLGPCIKTWAAWTNDYEIKSCKTKFKFLQLNIKIHVNTINLVKIIKHDKCFKSEYIH